MPRLFSGSYEKNGVGKAPFYVFRACGCTVGQLGMDRGQPHDLSAVVHNTTGGGGYMYGGFARVLGVLSRHFSTALLPISDLSLTGFYPLSTVPISMNTK
jgi:hypothetical protein